MNYYILNIQHNMTFYLETLKILIMYIINK